MRIDYVSTCFLSSRRMAGFGPFGNLACEQLCQPRPGSGTPSFARAAQSTDNYCARPGDDLAGQLPWPARYSAGQQRHFADQPATWAPTYPNATAVRLRYRACLLGARLPYNGILADPQMTPGGQLGQQLNQFALQQLQQAQQAFNMQNQQLGILNQPPPPVVQAARGGRVPVLPRAP